MTSSNGASLRSRAALDQPLAAAYAKAATVTALDEYGFGGLASGETVEPGSRALSAWIPGDRAVDRLAELERWRAQGKPLRFLFAERYHAVAVEARTVFQRRHLGNRIHFLARVQAHPERLLFPGDAAASKAWLREPVLNRLPLTLWMMGPVRDARVIESQRKGSRTVVVLLAHESPNLLSILEISASLDCTEGGAPAVRDSFECTGTDGFLRVNGIWQPSVHAPRIEMHRGAMVLVQRNLRRDLAQVFQNAAAAALQVAKQSAESYQLASAYLRACALVERQAT